MKQPITRHRSQSPVYLKIMSIRKKLLQDMVHDRAEPVKQSMIQSVSRKRTDRNYAFAAKVCSGASVLDIGPGFGLGYEHVLAANPKSITCMDYHAKAEANFLVQDDRIQFLCGDFYQNELVDGSFDVILCIATIYYLPDLDGFFNQVRRLLRPGGALVINHFDLDVIMHYFGCELCDLDARYGKLYRGVDFAWRLEEELGGDVEHHLQSEVSLESWGSRLTLPLRLISTAPEIVPARDHMQGVYNMYVVRKA